MRFPSGPRNRKWNDAIDALSSIGAASAAVAPFVFCAKADEWSTNDVSAAMASDWVRRMADIALKTFPYLSPSLDGNLYFKQPDKEAVVFDTVPALAAQFKKLYPRIEPPDQWPSIYTMTVAGDDNGMTTFRLVPKKHGRVSHLDVKADDASATIRSMTWTYEDGGYVTFDQKVETQSGNVLIKSQTGHVELPSYKADVQIAYSNYKLNVAVDDAVFAPDK